MPSRAANAGTQRLMLYIEFWDYYLPDVYSTAKAMLLLRETDDAAATAWQNRMTAMRDGCRAIIDMLQAENTLADQWTRDTATDTLWTLLSISNWESLTIECGWSNQQYIDNIKSIADKTLLKHQR